MAGPVIAAAGFDHHAAANFNNCLYTLDIAHEVLYTALPHWLRLKRAEIGAAVTAARPEAADGCATHAASSWPAVDTAAGIECEDCRAWVAQYVRLVNVSEARVVARLRRLSQRRQLWSDDDGDIFVVASSLHIDARPPPTIDDADVAALLNVIQYCAFCRHELGYDGVAAVAAVKVLRNVTSHPAATRTMDDAAAGRARETVGGFVGHVRRIAAERVSGDDDDAWRDVCEFAAHALHRIDVQWSVETRIATPAARRKNREELSADEAEAVDMALWMSVVVGSLEDAINALNRGANEHFVIMESEELSRSVSAGVAAAAAPYVSSRLPSATAGVATAAAQTAGAAAAAAAAPPASGGGAAAAAAATVGTWLVADVGCVGAAAVPLAVARRPTVLKVAWTPIPRLSTVLGVAWIPLVGADLVALLVSTVTGMLRFGGLSVGARLALTSAGSVGVDIGGTPLRTFSSNPAVIAVAEEARRRIDAQSSWNPFGSRGHNRVIHVATVLGHGHIFDALIAAGASPADETANGFSCEHLVQPGASDAFKDHVVAEVGRVRAAREPTML